MPLQRIAIVGNSGAGKTTLARSLGSRLGLVHIELDGLFWQANWTPLSREAMRAGVDQALSGTTKWVTDGNYLSAGTHEVVWSRADTLIWLDLPLYVVLLRLLRRTALRVFTRQELWNGNKENVWAHLRFWDWNENLFVHCVRTHFRRRRLFPAILAHPDNAHLVVLRFRSVSEVDSWMAGLPQRNGGAMAPV